MSEDKKQKELTVKELKEIAPLSDIYLLNKYDKYLIFVEKSSLVGGYEIAYKKAQQVSAAMKKLNLDFVVIIGTDDGLKVLQLEKG